MGFTIGLAGVGSAVIAASPTVPVIDLVIWPSTNQVVQRGENGVGWFELLGQFHGPMTGVQVRATVMPGGSGTPFAWQSLAGVTFSGRVFHATMCLRSGGWYQLEFRPYYRGQFGPVYAVNRVGVGEVFITAGQSNSVNSAEIGPGRTVGDRVASFNGDQWAAARIPLPFNPGGGDCAWNVMADILVRNWNVPIGICPIGMGSTAVEDWQPGVLNPRCGLYHFDVLTTSILALQHRGGVRAVLWHQGEGNRFTPPAVYQALLSNLILCSRQVTGIPVAWVIAQVSYIPGTAPLPYGIDACSGVTPTPSIRQAQCAVTRTLSRVYQGPTTDDLGPPFRDAKTGAHMNARGNLIHGTRWGQVLLKTPALFSSRMW